MLALRPASSNDRERIQVFDVLERAAALVHLESMDGLQQGIALLREAAQGWRAAGDVELETSTLETLARMTSYFTQFNGESITARERLVELYAGLDSRDWELENWQILGKEYREAGRLTDAKRAASRAAALSDALGYPASAARPGGMSDCTNSCSATTIARARWRRWHATWPRRFTTG